MSAEPAGGRALHVLALAKALAVDARFADSLGQLVDLHRAETNDEALAALRTGLFDLIVAAPTDLFPLARAEARQRAELIVEHIGQGICIVDRGGGLVWGNAQFRSYPSEVADAILQRCAELRPEFKVGQTEAGMVGSRQLHVRVDQDHVFDLTVAPLHAAAGQVEEVVGLAQDVTVRQRLHDKIDAIDAAGRSLVRLDAEAADQLDMGERLALLEQSIDRFSHELLNFDHYVVRILDPKTNRLETLVASGLPEEAHALPLYAAPEGNGITGYVAATGKSYVCPDVRNDPRYMPGLERAGSSLTVPLRLHDQVVGVFNVESHNLNAFTEDDRQFCEMFGRYVAFALNILKLLAVERSTSTGQLAHDVATDLAVPLNDIIAAATRALEQAGGQEGLKLELRGIIDDVDRVKRNLQMLTEAPGVRGLLPERTQRDPLIDGKRILVAEDEDIIRETIADVLTKGGALTVMARDGQEAIGMLRAQHFDVVISDIKMPYQNGYEVFAAARETNIHCPVILVTGFGYDPEHSIVRASKEGLAAVLFKPFRVEELMEAVRQALTAPK